MQRRVPMSGFLAAACSGLLLALSFPSSAWGTLAWVALVPLLTTVEEHPFKKGVLSGCVFFAIVLYWLNIVMTTYGGLSPSLSVVAYLLLTVYLSLYFGCAVWLACRLKTSKGYSFALTLPVIWVGLEFARAYLMTGFPWATIGYSQQNLMMIQSADLLGVYGLSFLILFCNATVSEIVLALRQSQRLPAVSPLILACLLALNATYGYFCLKQPLDAREVQVNVAVIQGNIDQALKWNPDYRESSVDAYRQLSRQAGSTGPLDLVIWPEAATPFYFQSGGMLSQKISELPQQLHGHLLFGSPAFQGDAGNRIYLNSAFLLSPKGQIVGRSDKVHLVPFGEYVPMSVLLPFLNKLVVGIGDFSPGQVKPLDMSGYQLGVLVCYEAIFPELARRFVADGSDLLVNITNDAWFGRSSAPAQHLAMVRFRAIENRVWIARAANTGISAFVTPSGQIVSPSDLFETSYIVEKVGLGAQPGLYAKLGDLIPGFFLLISMFWLLQARPWRISARSL